MGRPLVTVVVPTYRRMARCQRLVDALAEQTLGAEEFEVVVVDNCSADDTFDRLAAWSATLPYRLRPLRTTINRGPAPARNLGWRHADAPIVAFTDDDCVPEPRWLEAGLGVMEGDAALGVVQGRTTAPAGAPVDPSWRWVHRQEIDGPTAHFEGCNVFYRREALEATGGFSETIGWWGEDAAAGWRVVEAGWRRAFAPDAIVYHDVEARGLRWHLRNGLLESNMVDLAATHPGFRAEAFWRPWAFRSRDAAFVAAAAGALFSLRWRPAAAAALPYLWMNRGLARGRERLRTVGEVILVDGARSAGQLRGAVRSRILVL
ncbi:MAG: glycosyltransferase family 2 protein [Acidimicrobiales bacterium]